jgi:hypothetical protein
VEPRRSASVALTREDKNVTVNGSSIGDGEAGVLPNRACVAATATVKFAGQTVAKGTVELRYRVQSSSGWEACTGRAEAPSKNKNGSALAPCGLVSLTR